MTPSSIEPNPRLSRPSWIASAPRRGPLGDRWSTGLLSGVAGFVDTAAFLTLAGLLPAHLTGDLAMAGAALGNHSEFGFAARLAVIPFFMLSVALAAVVARSFRVRGETPLAPLLALMTVALACFCAAGTALGPILRDSDAMTIVLIGCPGVGAMGIQNALMREVLGGLTPTTMMTGNLTQFTIDLVELALSTFQGKGDRKLRERVSRDARARLVKFGVPVAGFIVGAALGGWLTGTLGLLSIAVPTVLVMTLTVLAWRAAYQRARSRGRSIPPARPSFQSAAGF